MSQNERKVPELRFKGFTEDWEQHKLGNLAVFNPKDQVPEKFNYVDLESVKGTQLLRSIPIKKKDAPSRAQRVAQKQDLFIQTVRPYQKNNFFFDIDSEDKYVFSTGYAQLRAKIDAKFLLFYILNDLFVIKMMNRSTGTSYPAINTKDLQNIKVKTPKFKKEEKNIGELFFSFEKLQALYERKHRQLEQLKEALLQQMFPQKGEKVPRLRFADFGGDWEEKKFKDFLIEFSDRSTEENQHTILSSTNQGMEYRQGRTTSQSNIGYKIIRNDNLVISPQNLWLGNININNLGIGLVSPSYKTFKLDNIDKSFLNPQLKNDILLYEYANASMQGASVVRRNLEMKFFYKIKMRIPSMNEQKKIGILFAELARINEFYESSFQNIQQIKTKLLQSMFV